jgi:carboxymethylenebutenolidase
MKKLWTLCAALLSVVSVASAQSTMSCCTKPAAGQAATEVFAMLASNEDFSGGHDAPLPFTYAGEGSMIEFKTTDGQTGKAFEIKSKTKSDKYLFVIHEWWGLNDYIKQEAGRFAEELPGVNVIALDLYDGQIATDADQAKPRSAASAGALVAAGASRRPCWPAPKPKPAWPTTACLRRT